MTRSGILTIRTPEGIEFTLLLAGPVTRMLALAIDLAVIGAAGRILQSALAPLGFLGADTSGAVIAVAYFAVSLIYFALAEWIGRGQTIGKRLFRLRVVDAAGLRLEPSQVVVRNLMRFVDALPAFYLVGGAACVVNRYRQRLGDLAAGTVVVRVPGPSRPDLDQLLGNKYNSLSEQRHLAARLRQKVEPDVARIALESLLRRDELEPAARLKLFSELASAFRAMVVYPPEIVEQFSDEQYVRNVVEVLYRSSSDGGRASVPPVQIQAPGAQA